MKKPRDLVRSGKHLDYLTLFLWSIQGLDSRFREEHIFLRTLLICQCVFCGWNDSFSTLRRRVAWRLVHAQEHKLRIAGLWERAYWKRYPCSVNMKKENEGKENNVPNINQEILILQHNFNLATIVLWWSSAVLAHSYWSCWGLKVKQSEGASWKNCFLFLFLLLFLLGSAPPVLYTPYK